MRYLACHKGKTSPLLTFIVTVNNLLRVIATLRVASEVLFMLLPWSLGLSERVDVL